MYLISLFLADFHKGGIIMWIIFFAAVVAWMTGVEKLVSLIRFSFSRRKFLRFADSLCHNYCSKTGKTGFENYDLLLDQLRNSLQTNGYGCKDMLREFLISTVPFLEKHFSTMSVWISIAPLLGLLGTVVGMVETFNVITDFGIGNPSLTAEGISVALLTTQAGLISAFPAMIFHNYLLEKKDALISVILKDCEQIINKVNSSQTWNT
ncbi:MAG TPA: MotA/TolQ/ExbB proton channel family protein [Chitinispirillaceae bacterium]|nr:MotA/TolQ/ExbB proton channel family protein [Chitinispirillaceae bacterium]